VYRNFAADGVRHLLVTNFRNHPSAGDGLLNNLRAPLAAADRATRALDLNLLAAAWVAWIADAFFYDRARNVASFSHPFAGADVHNRCFRNRLAHGVANIAVAGFAFHLVGRAANFSVAGLVNRLADVVADRSVAGRVDRLADGVAHILVAGGIHRLADCAVDFFVAGLVDRLTDIVCAGAVACLINRFAYRVALVTVAGFVDISSTADGNRLGALIVHGLHAGILLLFPYNFFNRFVLRWATTRRSGEVARARA
jgi:hypothetical protein